jgi:hypothetical protein
MTDIIKSCETCELYTCEFNPNNDEVYFIDSVDQERKIYPGIEIIHEFVKMKGCMYHTKNIQPIDILVTYLKEGQEKYREKINTSDNGTKYKLAHKALTLCLSKIDQLKQGDVTNV